MNFLKRHPLAGLFLGVALVALGLLSLPAFSESADAASAPAVGAECRAAQAQFDDGYGLAPSPRRASCR